VIEPRELVPGEWSVLALIADAPGHGWALAKEMSPTGSVGRVWGVGRPLVYRALDVLASRGLIEPAGSERGARGPRRELYAATKRGREELGRWLAKPVDHVRDVRSVLLLKLVLLERAGIDRRPLLQAQRKQTVAAVKALESRLRHSVGTEHILARFRLETTRAVVLFIDALLTESGTERAAARGRRPSRTARPARPKRRS
jgi:DNA-binding PadR family transcriptional regulator